MALTQDRVAARNSKLVQPIYELVGPFDGAETLAGGTGVSCLSLDLDIQVYPATVPQGDSHPSAPQHQAKVRLGVQDFKDIFRALVTAAAFVVHRKVEGAGKPDVLLLATGSEVSLCIAAYEELKAAGIAARVVSMPSWELFEQQEQAYKDAVLPPDVTARVAVEKASILGWTRYTGLRGQIIGMRTFGASAPLAELQRQYGFTPGNIVAAAKEQVANART
nr:transketolase C-terminal domain-containing protein [Marinovum algicola]